LNVHLQASYTDNRWAPEVVILRPIRDLSVKEVTMYLYFANKDIPPTNVLHVEVKGRRSRSSVNEIVYDFLASTQKDFPSTVSVVNSSLGKLSPPVETRQTSEPCRLCSGLVETTCSPIRRLVRPRVQASRDSITEGICYSCERLALSSEAASSVVKILMTL